RNIPFNPPSMPKETDKVAWVLTRVNSSIMRKQNIKIEICANSLQSALNAQKAGADRVELCDNLFEGGTTPSAASIQLARKYLTSTELFVLIRPRGGHFCYNEIEMEVMLADIEFAKQTGVDGVVLGILQSDGRIDIERTRQLVEAAKPLETTFHRAFDVCANPFEALEQIIDLGIDRILTSGQEQTAILGANFIQQLVKQATNRIVIMPGAGINAQNIVALQQITQAKEFHLSAKALTKSRMIFQNEKVNFGGKVAIPERDYFESSLAKIKELRNI
ncbi:MAG: copper homeostasis protein CutC, partial [Chitinophagales bacterium]